MFSDRRSDGYSGIAGSEIPEITDKKSLPILKIGRDYGIIGDRKTVGLSIILDGCGGVAGQIADGAFHRGFFLIRQRLGSVAVVEGFGKF